MCPEGNISSREHIALNVRQYISTISTSSGYINQLTWELGVCLSTSINTSPKKIYGKHDFFKVKVAYTVKKVIFFPSPAGLSLTKLSLAKLSLAGNSSIIPGQ
jgi:hypothetical protein